MSVWWNWRSASMYGTNSPLFACFAISFDRRRRSRMVRSSTSPAIETVAGTSSMSRSCMMSSSSLADSSTTRKPLLRTVAISPCCTRLSMASRTGMADTPNSSASTGTE